MKTISLDHPVRVYFKDGECHHDSATIMIDNGFPSFIRARGPDVIYPWENVKHVIRVAEEPAEADITKRLRASVAAIAEERNGAKQEAHALRDELEQTKRGWRIEREIAENYKRDLGQAFNEIEQLKRYRHIVKGAEADLASVTEQRDVLKRQIEELRAEMRKPKAPARAIVARGINKGEVVEVLETSGSQSRVRFDNGNEVMVETSFLDNVTSSPLETKHNPPDAEHQQAQNRDKWRATCLANGAKDCTVFFGPGDEVTFVVELKTGTSLDDIKDVLCGAYGFDSTNCKIREVRPIVDGVKPSTFKHPADNGQP